MSRTVVVPAEALVLVTVSDNAKSEADRLGVTASLRLQLERIHIPIILPPFISLVAESADDPPADAPETANTGDRTELALMLGRYAGQISARIERAWVQPQSPADGRAVTSGASAERGETTGDQTFRCKVQIRQDARGNVEEVLLLACNGTEEWRHSLVVAINQASPLPAPPTPKVFTRALTMSFEGRPSGPGSGVDQSGLRQ